MKKAYFIFNPYSGKQTGKDILKLHIISVIDKITKAGYEVTIRPTQCRLDACDMVKNACNKKMYDIIVCSGGDGTMNEVIQGIMSAEYRIPVLYLPTGTTNDFAKSLGIPKNPDEACESINNGSIFSCDICSFNDRYFTYVAAFGAFTEVVYETPQQFKNMLGHAAYILEGMKRIKSLETSYHLKITYDDGKIVEDDFVFGMVTNSTSVGGFISTSSNVSLNDGVFEVTFIKKPKTLIEFQNVITALLSKKQDIENAESAYIVSFKASELSIESEIEIPWTLDGEFGGSEHTIVIKDNMKAVDFIINTELKSL